MIKTPEMVVLTGGPASGKSTILNRIEETYSDTIQTVPEAARLLIENGFPVPGVDVDWTPTWQVALQDAILPLQLSLESTYAEKARAQGKNLLVCDRGILDGAAYTPGGVPEFLKRHNLDYYAVLERYHTVLHLGSIAAQHLDTHQQSEIMKTRIESIEIMQELETAILIAWKHHHNQQRIPATDNPDAKINLALESIEHILNTTT